MAEQIIATYGLKADAKILDVGCGKAYLLYELQQLLPNAEIVGFDISKHGITTAPEPVRSKLMRYRAQDAYQQV